MHDDIRVFYTVRYPAASNVSIAASICPGAVSAIAALTCPRDQFIAVCR